MDKVFNEWMRRYTEHPEQFGREWQTVAAFLKESASGVEPSYGTVCEAYYKKIASELGIA